MKKVLWIQILFCMHRLWRKCLVSCCYFLNVLASSPFRLGRPRQMMFSRRSLTTRITGLALITFTIVLSSLLILQPLLTRTTFFPKHHIVRTNFSLQPKVSPHCLNNFLASIEKTANFRDFCDNLWNRSDIICKQFLQQNDIAIKDNCLLPNNSNIVPRIVYYAIFSPRPGAPPEFSFMHYLSIVSARKFIFPWAIYVISDAPPYGYWWTRVLSDVKGVRYVFRPLPVLTSEKLKFIQHASDIVRLQTLIVNGGIYMDTDMMILKPIDFLLNTSLSMGLVDEKTGIGNAFIVAERESAFLKEWYLGYRHFNNTHLFENSLWTAKRLWLRNKAAVNDIADMIYRPNWFDSKKLFRQVGFDWKSQYAVHVWHRHGHVPENPDEINKLNTTLGEIFRFIYYGSDDLMSV